MYSIYDASKSPIDTTKTRQYYLSHISVKEFFLYIDVFGIWFGNGKAQHSG